ncbi:MAG: hypothetical protein QG597_4366 [Actinomycetota bacterium]|nr:hypothetical protein [Actinomycetota bacterium]
MEEPDHNPPAIAVCPTALQRQTASFHVRYWGFGTIIATSILWLVLAAVGVPDAVWGWAFGIGCIALMGTPVMAAVRTWRAGEAAHQEMDRGYTTLEQVRKMPDQSHFWLLDNDGNVIIPPGQVWFSPIPPPGAQEPGGPSRSTPLQAARPTLSFGHDHVVRPARQGRIHEGSRLICVVRTGASPYGAIDVVNSASRRVPGTCHFTRDTGVAG